MLRYFGADVHQTIGDDGSHIISLQGEAVLHSRQITVRETHHLRICRGRGIDHPDSDVIIPGIAMNPLRTGLQTLTEMGGSIERVNERTEGGEIIADLHIKSASSMAFKCLLAAQHQ